MFALPHLFYHLFIPLHKPDLNIRLTQAHSSALTLSLSHTHTHTRTHTDPPPPHTHINTHACRDTETQTQTHTHTRARARTHVHTHTHIRPVYPYWCEIVKCQVKKSKTPLKRVKHFNHQKYIDTNDATSLFTNTDTNHMESVFCLFLPSKSNYKPFFFLLMFSSWTDIEFLFWGWIVFKLNWLVIERIVEHRLQGSQVLLWELSAAWFSLHDKEGLCCLLQHGRLSLFAGLVYVCVCVCVCCVCVCVCVCVWKTTGSCGGYLWSIFSTHCVCV